MNIVFATAARNSIQRSERGVVGMIIKDINIPDENPVMVYKEGDIPASLNEENKTQIKFALKGNDTTPLRVVVYVLPKSAENYNEALGYFELKKVTWLCCPTVKSDNQEEEMITWVKDQREHRNKVKLVLPHQFTTFFIKKISYRTF